MHTYNNPESRIGAHIHTQTHTNTHIPVYTALARMQASIHQRIHANTCTGMHTDKQSAIQAHHTIHDQVTQGPTKNWHAQARQVERMKAPIHTFYQYRVRRTERHAIRQPVRQACINIHADTNTNTGIHTGKHAYIQAIIHPYSMRGRHAHPDTPYSQTYRKTGRHTYRQQTIQAG